ncbi:MAG: preprotein translocase subunit SecE [Bullifex sp.]
MKKIIRYFKECYLEMKKVSWPSRQMVFQSTKIVIISTVVFALILGLVDFLLLKGIFIIF